jgi:hypothetical protein
MRAGRQRALKRLPNGGPSESAGLIRSIFIVARPARAKFSWLCVKKFLPPILLRTAANADIEIARSRICASHEGKSLAAPYDQETLNSCGFLASRIFALRNFAFASRKTRAAARDRCEARQRIAKRRPIHGSLR